LLFRLALMILKKRAQNKNKNQKQNQNSKKDLRANTKTIKINNFQDPLTILVLYSNKPKFFISFELVLFNGFGKLMALFIHF
jgi:hypothetical protein